jgi:hypothetical protein
MSSTRQKASRLFEKHDELLGTHTTETLPSEILSSTVRQALCSLYKPHASQNVMQHNCTTTISSTSHHHHSDIPKAEPHDRNPQCATPSKSTTRSATTGLVAFTTAPPMMTRNSAPWPFFPTPNTRTSVPAALLPTLQLCRTIRISALSTTTRFLALPPPALTMTAGAQWFVVYARSQSASLDMDIRARTCNLRLCRL